MSTPAAPGQAAGEMLRKGTAGQKCPLSPVRDQGCRGHRAVLAGAKGICGVSFRDLQSPANDCHAGPTQPLPSSVSCATADLRTQPATR